MIPIKLTMRNFMPYRDNVPPLDFKGIHTASIWGENGSGKSSIIDAMTWALWGKTRAKSDDDIIHLGQNETLVEFDFAVGQQIYRIIRKHSRPKRAKGSGQSALDLLIKDKDGFKPVSGNIMRETEQKIRDLLHMDYDTFVNSAFLRQGHADEFTIATPAKRKDVLADILGLSSYDALEEQAREMARECEGHKNAAESSIKEFADELVQRPAAEAELAHAQNELSDIEKALSDGENRLKELRQKKELLEGKQQQLIQLEKHVAETTRNLTRWNDQIKRRESRIQEYEAVIAHRAEIENGHAELVQAKKSDDELNRKVSQVRELEKRKHDLVITIERAQSAVMTEHKIVLARISDLEKSTLKLPELQDELQHAQVDIKQLAVEDENLKQKKQVEQDTREAILRIETEGKQLKKEIEEIDEKLALLEKQAGAVCPVCGQELGEQHRRQVLERFIQEKEEKTVAIKTRQNEFRQKQAELKSLSADLSHLEAALGQSRTAAQTHVNRLEQQIQDAKKASSQADEEKKHLSEIQEKLTGRSFAAGEQTALAQLEGELAKLGYDARQHEQIRLKLAELEKWESQLQKLDEAGRLIKQEKESIASEEQTAQELNHSLETDSQTRQHLAGELAPLPQVTSDLAAAEADYRRQSACQKQAQETVGTIKGRLERFARLEIRIKEKKDAVAQFAKDEAIYRDLAYAFGKKGIQAWLIEMALPEIELETNRLLGRMTDNRMHIKIETQRQTKAGDTAETLDIKIADELGTRNYEMYSGGEAFRINFAIRIALSKLLARRAGAPLPTLIIDEGFGTQDATGLEKLKEAIISIQDDFKMILVITHVEEMRDAFPTRIDVTKTADGSTVVVS